MRAPRETACEMGSPGKGSRLDGGKRYGSSISDVHEFEDVSVSHFRLHEQPLGTPATGPCMWQFIMSSQYVTGSG